MKKKSYTKKDVGIALAAAEAFWNSITLNAAAEIVDNSSEARADETSNKKLINVSNSYGKFECKLIDDPTNNLTKQEV